MKRILACSLLVMLAACEPEIEESHPVGNLSLPPELADCKFFRLSDGNTVLHVARCPGSTTSVTSSGKNPPTTITADSAPVADEHAARVDAILKQIDTNIAKLEAQKTELQK